MRKPVVFLVCTGLGRINRGYESFTKECFEVLKDSDEFELYLLKGAGKSTKKEKVVFNFHRNGSIAHLCKKIFNQPAYSTEQKSFCFFLLPFIIRKKPSLIYYSDFALGSYLWHLRKYFHFKYKLLFCNGAPNGPPYKTEDHIQQLLPVYYNIGVKTDGNGCKHTLLPYAFNIDIEKNTASLLSKQSLRQKLGFSTDQKLILTVGAVNAYHKRIDYIINQVATLPQKYCLIIVGQHDHETSSLVQLAKEKLPGRHLVAHLNYEEVKLYYTIADMFVLASLLEGFPRVTIEAMSYGLPCIVHDYVVTRQILGDKGVYTDMRFDGELSRCIQHLPVYSREENMRYAYTNYSWNNLQEQYVNLIKAQLSTTNKLIDLVNKQ